MADKRCFVHFPHPGGEHKLERSGKISWNEVRHSHKRNFMQFRGEWIDEDGNTHTDNLRAWGEWEPESDIICQFIPQDRDRHATRHLWNPSWVPRNTYRCLHNTDPFIFGDCFLYSNCGQSAPRKCGLTQLERGSVIAFGSGKMVNRERKWVLDTLLVVKGFTFARLLFILGRCRKKSARQLDTIGGCCGVRCISNSLCFTEPHQLDTPALVR